MGGEKRNIMEFNVTFVSKNCAKAISVESRNIGYSLCDKHNTPTSETNSYVHSLRDNPTFTLSESEARAAGTHFLEKSQHTVRCSEGVLNGCVELTLVTHCGDTDVPTTYSFEQKINPDAIMALWASRGYANIWSDEDIASAGQAALDAK